MLISSWGLGFITWYYLIVNSAAQHQYPWVMQNTWHLLVGNVLSENHTTDHFTVTLASTWNFLELHILTNVHVIIFMNIRGNLNKWMNEWMNEWTRFILDSLSFPNSMTLHDFFYDLFKFFKTFSFAVSFKNFKNFPWFRVFFDLKQFNRHKLKKHAVYSSLSYIVLALSSAVTNLSYKTLIFHDFQGLIIIKFHDFPGLEMKFLNSMNFPGFLWPE